MKEYLSVFDCSALRDPYRAILAERVVPRLLSWLADNGFDARVSFDLRDAMEYQRLYRDDQRITYLPAFDHEYNPTASEADTVGVFLLRDGTPVGRIYSRLFWIEDSLSGAIEDLSLFYERPKMMAEEAAIVRNPDALASVKGCRVAIMTAGHIAKQFRGSPAYDACQRLCRAFILGKHYWSFVAALIEAKSSTKLGFGRYGHEQAISGVWLIHDQQKHPYELYLSDRPYLRRLLCRERAADLSMPLLDLDDTEITAAFRKRRSEFVWGKG